MTEFYIGRLLMGDNMEGTSIGRVIFVNKGTYNSNTQYKKLDIVRYNGNCFIAKIDTKGNTPQVNNLNDNYWQKMTVTGTYTPTLTNEGFLL